jgi:hypothetical protein
MHPSTSTNLEASSVLRLPGRLSIVGAASGVAAAQVEDAARRLADTYRDVPGLEAMTPTWLALPRIGAGVVILARQSPTLRLPLTIAWGMAIGADGPATNGEIDRVLTTPRRVLELGGVFVLVRVTEDSVRLVTSTDFLLTLRRSHGAFATRAMAALAIAGVTARVNRHAIGQAVAWHAVAPSGEVLADVTACEEGTLVDIDARGVRQSSIVSLGERLAIGRPLTAPEFRVLLGAEVRRASTAPDARLGLTAGRDSVLAASCLAEVGGSISTYTLGYRGYPDARGARAVASALAWPHQILPIQDVRGHKISRIRDPTIDAVAGDVTGFLIRHAPWAEGLQLPRDAVSGHITSSDSPFTALTGHGGGIGRAVYWTEQPDGDPVETMVTRNGRGAILPEVARREFAAVVADEVQVALDAGRPDAVLDVVYMRYERCWLDHTGLPDGPVASLLPLYLSATVCKALIDVPREERIGGIFFDRALALDPRDLRRIATAASVSRRLPTARLGRFDPYRVPNDWPLLRDIMARFAPDGWLVRDVLGDAWWRWAEDNAPEQWWVRMLLWRAVAIESLHRWCNNAAPPTARPPTHRD